MRRVLNVLSLTLCLVLPLAALAGDWAQFRGPQANGISPEKGIKKSWSAAPKMLWRVPMGDDGYSGPAVAGGKVFIIDHQGGQDVVRAINFSTGKDAWSFKYADATNNNYGFARSTPVIDGGKVYIISRNGQVHCLNAANGSKVWTKNIQSEFGGKKPQWDYSMSPYIDGNKLIVCPGGPNAAVAALDKNSGKTLWKGGGSDAPGYATPVAATIGGKKQYVIFTAKSLIGVDPANGKLLWSFPWQTSYDVNAAVPIVHGNTIFITSGYGKGCALVEVNGGKATQKWMNREIQSQFTTPIFAGGYLYSTSDPGFLVCMDAKTGAVKWKERGFEKGGLVAADGTLIVMDGRSGDVAMVSMTPSGYKRLGSFKPLGGQSWTAPIVADGKLILRNKNTLACISLK